MSSRTFLTRCYSLPALHFLGDPEWGEEENERLFGPCYRLHGHDYYVEVTVSGPVNETSGMLVGRDELDRIVRPALIDPLAQTNLNKRFEKTSGEALAVSFFRILEPVIQPPLQLVRLALRETPKNTFIAGPAK